MTLEDLLDMVEESDEFHMTTLTEVKLKGGKKNLHQGRVTKRNANMVVTTDPKGYVKAINDGLVAEGKDPTEYVPSPPKWGIRYKGPVWVHKGQYYLQVVVKQAGKTTWYLDGQEIDKDKVVGVPEHTAANQGGLKQKVIIRRFKIEGIEGLDWIL